MLWTGCGVGAHGFAAALQKSTALAPSTRSSYHSRLRAGALHARGDDVGGDRLAQPARARGQPDVRGVVKACNGEDSHGIKVERCRKRTAAPKKRRLKGVAGPHMRYRRAATWTSKGMGRLAINGARAHNAGGMLASVQQHERTNMSRKAQGAQSVALFACCCVGRATSALLRPKWGRIG